MTTTRLFLTATAFFFCGILSAQFSQVVYSADGLSGELRIRSEYLATPGTHPWNINLPAGKQVRVTRINNAYLHSDRIFLYDSNNMGVRLLNHSVPGEFSTILTGVSSLYFVLDNHPNLAVTATDPVIIIRFSAISNTGNSGISIHYGNVELRNSGILRAEGFQNFMGSQVSAVLGADFRSYTTFGSPRGGRIRGSDQGFLVLEGNPNGWGAPRVYINRFVPHGHVIMTGASGRVGLGIDHPLEKLHIGGAVRGDGIGGALRVRTQHGELSLGSQNIHGTHFTTNRPHFIFNRPILTTEVRIKSIDNFPDYVFEEGYYLRSLSSVNQFIQTYGHLPDIPSAAHVKEHGIGLVELSLMMMRKIEELTLHAIAQEYRIKDLEARLGIASGN